MAVSDGVDTLPSFIFTLNYIDVNKTNDTTQTEQFKTFIYQNVRFPLQQMSLKMYVCNFTLLMDTWGAPHDIRVMPFKKK